MFPPERIAATFLPTNLGYFKIAASTIAPENSTTIFILSINSLEASIISYSDTITMSLRYVLRTLKVLSPKFVLTPSATLLGGYCG